MRKSSNQRPQQGANDVSLATKEALLFKRAEREDYVAQTERLRVEAQIKAQESRDDIRHQIELLKYEAQLQRDKIEQNRMDSLEKGRVILTRFVMIFMSSVAVAVLSGIFYVATK